MPRFEEQYNQILAILREASKDSASRGLSFTQIQTDSLLSLTTVRRRLTELEDRGSVYRRNWPNNSGMRGRDVHLWNLKADSPLRNTRLVERSITTAKHGGEESPRHKALKEYIAANPSRIGLPASSKPDVEHRFLSPDRADVIFALPQNRWVAVEVELEGERETLAGAWQAAKYRTLLCLENEVPLVSKQVNAVLVAYAIPVRARRFCELYDIQWHEVDIID